MINETDTKKGNSMDLNRQHIEAMEQELSLAGVIPQQIISSQKAAELKLSLIHISEPTRPY